MSRLHARLSVMNACIVCANDCFRDLPMDNSAVLTHVARDFIQGMSSTLGNKDGLKNFQSKRRGTCIVERCARFIEAPCHGCRKADCQRCTIVAELRAAEDQINADRDAELIELVSGDDLEEVVDNMIGNLCADHAAFGPVLMGQWFTRRNFMTETTAGDAPQDT
jgi:hypothetical protein